MPRADFGIFVKTWSIDSSTRRRVAPAVDIRSRLGGVAEHVAEGGPVGSVPADLSLVRPGANTVGELDVVIDEVAQQSAHRAPPLEDREHQPNDLPDPLVRIEGN